jgi:gluconokinase
VPVGTVRLSQAELPIVLTIDIGSSSVRTAAIDRRGRVIDRCGAVQAHRLRAPEPGAAEADAEQLFRRTMSCIDAAVDGLGRRVPDVSAVGVTTLVSNLVGIDREGRALTPLYTYADTRAEADARRLREELDEEQVHDRTGCRLHTSYLPARLHWLRRTRAADFAGVDRWVTIGELLSLRLLGRTAVSHSVASWSGLLDRRRMEWDQPLLDRLQVSPHQLSGLVDIAEPFVGLVGRYAKRWPALRDVPWFPAIGDGAAANIGCGCVSPRRLALSVGTSSALRLVTEQPPERLPWGLWCYCVDRKRALPGGALTEGGNLYAWARQVLQLGRPERIEQKLAAMTPDSHGLTVLPFLSGERSPGWAGHARGAFQGVTVSTTALDLLRAALEAVALRLAIVFEELARLSGNVEAVVAGGGAISRSPAWLQMMADAFGRPISATETVETTCRGVGLLALESLGVLDGPLEEIALLPGRIFEPVAEHHAIYRRALERQRWLYDELVANREAEE